METNNWKLKKIADVLEQVHPDSIKFINHKLEELGIKQLTSEVVSNDETFVDWNKLQHFSFFFDYENNVEEIKNALLNSKIAEYNFLIITYGWGEPVIRMPVNIFINDWEGILQSAQYETLIFSSDYKYIIEISRDYHMHSNFKIK